MRYEQTPQDVCGEANQLLDQFRFLGSRLPTPPLNQHFALNDSKCRGLHMRQGI